MELIKFFIFGSLTITAIYVFYHFFLESRNRPRLNRIYLISGILIVFLIPIILLAPTQEIGAYMFVLPDITTNVKVGLQNQITQSETSSLNFTFLRLILLFYFTGLIIYLIKNIRPVVRLLGIISSSNVKQEDGFILVFAGMHTKQAFSFFNYIILPVHNDSECNPLILAHEKAHIELKHHYDLILLFVFGGLFWFLPFAHFYAQKLKAVHEFEADAEVVKQTSGDAYAKCLLEQAFNVKSFSFFSHFSKPGLLKKRIHLLSEEQKKGFSLPHFLYWPLIGILISFVAYAQQEGPNPLIIEGEIFKVVDEMPVYAGDAEALMAYLQKVKYPEEAIENGIEGNVFVQFVVAQDGRIGNVEIVRSSGYEILDKYAVKHILNMPIWESAGKHEGAYVNVQFTVPFRFQLPQEELQE